MRGIQTDTCKRPTATKVKIASVQYLRALAATGVIVFHSLGQLGSRTGFTADWTHLGAAGVDLFFILSGFVMWITAVARDEHATIFIAKRITRIVPLYWLVTSVVLLIQIAKPNLMRSGSLDAAHYLLSYLFIACRHPVMQEHFWPPVIPGWTLNYEMLFYAVVAVSLTMAQRWRLPFICAAVALPVAVGLALHPPGVASFYTNSILLEFLFGMGIGRLFSTDLRQRGLTSWLLVLAGTLLFFLLGKQETEASRAVTWGLPLALVVQGAVRIPVNDEGVLKRMFRIVGDASYSIYLVQFIVIPPVTAVLARFLLKDGGTWHSVAFVAAIIACSLVVGVATYYFVELPMLGRLRSLHGRRGSTTASAGATAAASANSNVR